MENNKDQNIIQFLQNILDITKNFRLKWSEVNDTTHKRLQFFCNLLENFRSYYYSPNYNNGMIEQFALINYILWHIDENMFSNILEIPHYDQDIFQEKKKKAMESWKELRLYINPDKFKNNSKELWSIADNVYKKNFKKYDLYNEEDLKSSNTPSPSESNAEKFTGGKKDDSSPNEEEQIQNLSEMLKSIIPSVKDTVNPPLDNTSNNIKELPSDSEILKQNIKRDILNIKKANKNKEYLYENGFVKINFKK